jgi:hypothetical protein
MVEFRSRGKVLSEIQTTYDNKVQASSWAARIRLAASDPLNALARTSN